MDVEKKIAEAGGRLIRVLLVEHRLSEVVTIRSLLAGFTGARFVVEEAHLLSSAVERLASVEIDVVLLGSRLPDGDWRGAMETPGLRSFDKPIILLVGPGDRDQIPHALRMGAKDCIVTDSIDSLLLGRVILRHVSDG